MADVDYYLATMPDRPDLPEFSFEKRNYGSRHPSMEDYQQWCQEAVRFWQLTTPRAEPQQVRVQLFRLKIVKGQIARQTISTYTVTPPLERMTADEYSAEMDEILAALPGPFRAYVGSEAYERGHSAGYEEVVGIAQAMADALKQPIADYRKQVLAGNS
jgi:hypothetical protein